MARVSKVIELLAQSEKSWEDAAKAAINEASQTLRNIRSIYIKDFKAVVEGGKIAQYRVNGKVSSDLDSARTDKARVRKK
jgi:flavin-binding protein dodecin